MDPSTFTDSWELSRLNRQMLMSDSSLEDHDHFKIPQFSQNQSSSNVPFRSFTCSPLEYLACSPLEYRVTKIPKTISWRSGQVRVPMESSMINYHCQGLTDWKYQKTDEQVSKKDRHKEHNIAERKRREKLSQRFIALASIIPGLKKADKVSILGNTITYVTELEQNLRSLEDQKAKGIADSVVLVKKSMLSEDDSSIDNNFINGKLSSPEIQVRVCEKSVLVKILCENIKGVLVKVLSEIEKLHLTVTNASAMPFVNSFLDITVTAQMEEGFSKTGKDLAKEISSIFHHSK